MRWPLTRISDLFWATSVRDCLICSQCSVGVRSVPIADFKVAGKYVANMCFALLQLVAISSDFSIMFLLVGNIKNLHRFLLWRVLSVIYATIFMVFIFFCYIFCLIFMNIVWCRQAIGCFWVNCFH